MHKILIVDDEPGIRSLLVAAFRNDYQALAAADGREALALLQKEAPELILLDIDMPGMNGLDALAAIRATGKNVCVLMLTSTETLAVAERALELGADEYITKPFDLARLRNIVAARLGPGGEDAPWKIGEEEEHVD